MVTNHDEPALKILLIDDEALVRDELGEILVEEGYELAVAVDGEEGMQVFRDRRPDMVITDIRMPRRDGLSLAGAIRQQAPAVPVTVITGHGNEAMVLEALRAGVTDFIKKPVNLDDLGVALRRMEAAVQSARREALHLPASIVPVEQRWVYRLGNDLTVIGSFVDLLLKQIRPTLSARVVSELSLALRELLVNAIEHGNLGLTYEDKARALETGSLQQVLAERLQQPACRDRSVTVTAERREDELTVAIRDEGDGFDWRALPDPTDPANLLAVHGRGILLARVSVDALTFNEVGNQVTVVRSVGERQP